MPISLTKNLGLEEENTLSELQLFGITLFLLPQTECRMISPTYFPGSQDWHKQVWPAMLCYQRHENEKEDDQQVFGLLSY